MRSQRSASRSSSRCCRRSSIRRWSRALPEGPLSEDGYTASYRRVGRRADRERQIELMYQIGQYLDGVVRKPIVRALVHLARGPAHAAGFGGLQDFLERGLAAFEKMGGASQFLGRAIRDREHGRNGQPVRSGRGRRRGPWRGAGGMSRKERRPPALAPAGRPGRTAAAGPDRRRRTGPGGRKTCPGGSGHRSSRRWPGRGPVAGTAIATQLGLRHERAAAEALAASLKTADPARADRRARRCASTPNPRSWSAVAGCAHRLARAAGDDSSYSCRSATARLREFAVTIDKVDQGRMMVVQRMAPDSNGDLRIALNSSRVRAGRIPHPAAGLHLARPAGRRRAGSRLVIR